MSTDAEKFLADMLPKQRAAEQAIHNGDVEPRLALWSRHDPVTLYGAKLSASGWSDLESKFREVASWFADSVAYEFEVVAAGASRDLAYTVGYEHNHVSVDGQPTTYTLRVTHIYRREDGQWRIVHRHADVPPTSNGAPTFPPRAATTDASAGETGAA
jgi:ketosteroid isomerase-like protein